MALPAPPAPARPALLTAAAVAAGALGAAALLVRSQVRRAEREHPPVGRFLEVDGTRLHVLDVGRGRPLVLLHGNLTLVEDFVTSGLVGLATPRFRTVAIDRPGYGRSERPRDRVWTPGAQADLVRRLIDDLGLDRPIVLGHSFGAIVALDLALRHPDAVAAVVLASGYYFPTARVEVPFAVPSALPVVGDVLRHTVTPLVTRLNWPVIGRMLFGPAPTNPRFDALRWLMLSPSSLRSSGSESAMMVPVVATLQRHYGELRVPAVIAAGTDDRFVDSDYQSGGLHRALPGSDLIEVRGAGHMVHHASPQAIMGAIDLAARRADEGADPRRARGGALAA